MNGGMINKRYGNEVKSYNKIKIILSLLNSAIVFIFLAVLAFTGVSKDFANLTNQFTESAYLSLIIFTLLIFAIETTLLLPISFYSGFYIEHKFKLSNQKFTGWLFEGMKSGLLTIAILLPLALLLLYILKSDPANWWIWIGTVVTFFSVILAGLAPVLILPLFYKFSPVENPELKQKILALAHQAGIKISGIFVFNLSKETKKANAGFTGIGKTKRIILSDTLINNFTDDEIEIVFAHEMGHYKHGHILKGMMVNTILSFGGLFLVSVIIEKLIPYLGYAGLDDIAAFPLIILLLSLYGFILMPLTNYYSRRNEKAADYYAVEVTKNIPAFESAMDKLSDLNLADKNPNKFVEFFLYSHPSIDNRKKYIKNNFENV